MIGKEFRELFFEGCQVHGRTYNATIVGAKGDLKWYCRVANFAAVLKTGASRLTSPVATNVKQVLPGLPGRTWVTTHAGANRAGQPDLGVHNHQWL